MRNRISLILAGLVLIVAGCNLTFPARGQDPAGKPLFEKRCGGCHALDRDKEGPRLGNVYGRVAGSVDSFQYSAALKASKIRWTDDTLDKWLAGPDNVVPDNEMAFRVENAEERRAIVEYLGTVAKPRP
jgi:cytochrome c